MSGRLSRRAKSAASSLFKRVASGQDWEDGEDTTTTTRGRQSQAKNAEKKSTTPSKSPRNSPARIVRILDPAVSAAEPLPTKPKGKVGRPRKQPQLQQQTKQKPKDVLVETDGTDDAPLIPKQLPAKKKSHKKKLKYVIIPESVANSSIEPEPEPEPPLASEPTEEAAPPPVVDVPVKRKRGRPPKKKPGVASVSPPPSKKVKDASHKLLVPKIIIIKSPVTSPVKLTKEKSQTTADDDKMADKSGANTEMPGPGKDMYTVASQDKADTSVAPNSSQQSQSDNTTGDSPRKKKKYSIMDSKRKSPKTEGQKYIPPPYEEMLKVYESLPSPPQLLPMPEYVEPDPVPIIPLKKKRGRKKKVILPPSPPPKEVPAEDLPEASSSSSSKKSPKSTQHPSSRLNQDQFCDIFGLIKKSELTKHGYIHKLHREAGGKLRRTIKPRMAPEMVYRKYTIAKGCTIQGLMDESEESDLPDSQEGSPGGYLRSRMFHYEERVRRKGAGVKSSPIPLMKTSSFKENEEDFIAQRKLDFGAPSHQKKDKKEWLKPPSKKRIKIMDADSEELEDWKNLDDKKKTGSKKGTGSGPKKGPDMWAERPWMKEYIYTTKAKMAIEMKEREEKDVAGARRSVRQRGTQRKQWWHLLRANPDEYDEDIELEPEPETDIPVEEQPMAAKKPKVAPVRISQKDMLEVVRWLEDEEDREKMEQHKKEYAEKMQRNKEAAAMAKKRNRKKKKAENAMDALTEATKASVVEQLKPVLATLFRNQGKVPDGNIIELSLPMALALHERHTDDTAPMSFAAPTVEDLAPEDWPSLGYWDKADECKAPHMCPVCWINDHMYCRNMKRIARDLPPCGGCLHYIPCEHYRHLKTSLVYEYRKGPLFNDDPNTGFHPSGVRSVTIEDGKVFDPENRKPPTCGEDLICEETIFESDSDPSAPCSPEGNDLLRLHLKVREAQIKQSLGVTKMPSTPYPLSTLDVIEETIVVDEADTEVEISEYSAEVTVDSEGNQVLPNHYQVMVNSDVYRNGLPPSITGSADGGSGVPQGEMGKMRIRILPLPADKLKQQELMNSKEHNLVKVTMDKGGSQQVVMESSSSAKGGKKESVIYVKEATEKASEDQHSDKVLRLPEKMEQPNMLNSDVLGEIILQEALRLVAKGDASPQMLTLTFGPQLFEQQQSSEPAPTTTTTTTTTKKKKRNRKKPVAPPLPPPPPPPAPLPPSPEKPVKQVSNNSEVMPDDIPWTVETISDNEEGSDSLPEEFVQHDNTGLMFTVNQDFKGQKVVSLDSRDVQLKSPSKILEMWKSPKKRSANGKDKVKTPREKSNEEEPMDVSTNKSSDATGHGASPSDGKAEDAGEAEGVAATQDGNKVASDQGTEGDTLSFTTKDIRECKPALLSYIKEAKLGPMITAKLRVEKENLLTLLKEAQYADYIREIREELEQQKCLLAALQSEKEVWVEKIDQEENRLQNNDVEAANLRKKKEEVENNLSHYTEKCRAAAEMVRVIRQDLGLPEAPDPPSLAEDAEVAMAMGYPEQYLSAGDGVVMDGAVVVKGMAANDDMKDLDMQLRDPGKAGIVPTSVGLADHPSPSQMPDRMQKFTIIGPGAQAFSSATSGFQPIETQPHMSQHSSVRKSASPGQTITIARPKSTSNQMAGMETDAQLVQDGAVSPHGAMSTPKPIKAPGKKPARRPSQGKVVPGSKAKGKSSIGPKVKVTKETFPGGLQLLKMKLPNSDKEGYFVESTNKTLIQVTQIVMSEDKVSQLKLAVNKPIVAAGIQMEQTALVSNSSVAPPTVSVSVAPPSSISSGKINSAPRAMGNTQPLLPTMAHNQVPFKQMKPRKKTEAVHQQRKPVFVQQPKQQQQQQVPQPMQLQVLKTQAPQMASRQKQAKTTPVHAVAPRSGYTVVLPGQTSMVSSSAQLLPQGLLPAALGSPALTHLTPSRSMPMMSLLRPQSTVTPASQAPFTAQPGVQYLVTTAPDGTQTITTQAMPGLIPSASQVTTSSGQGMTPGDVYSITQDVVPEGSLETDPTLPSYEQANAALAQHIGDQGYVQPQRVEPEATDNSAAYAHEALQTLIAALQGNSEESVVLTSESQTTDLAALAEAAATAAMEIHPKEGPPETSEVIDPAVCANAQMMDSNVPQTMYEIQTDDGQIVRLQGPEGLFPNGFNQTDLAGLLDGTSQYIQSQAGGQDLHAGAAAELVQNVLAQSGIMLEENQQIVAFDESSLPTEHSQNVVEQVLLPGESSGQILENSVSQENNVVQSEQFNEEPPQYEQVEQYEEVLTEQYKQVEQYEQVVQGEQVQVPPEHSEQYGQVKVPMAEGEQVQVRLEQAEQYGQVQVPLEQAEQYEQVQVPLEQAEEYEQVQVPLEQAEQVQVPLEQGEQYEQVQVPLEQAEQYVQVQVPLEQAEQYEQVQVRLEQAEQYGQVQVPLEQAEQYEQVQVPLEQAEEYEQVQVPLEQAEEYEQVQVPLEQAEQYEQVQVPVEQTKQYEQVPLEQAEQYEQVQVPMEQAVQYEQVQVPMEEVEQVQDPVKQVEQVPFEQSEQVQVPTEEVEQVHVSMEEVGQVPPEQVAEQYEQVQVPPEQAEQYEQVQVEQVQAVEQSEQYEQVQTDMVQYEQVPIDEPQQLYIQYEAENPSTSGPGFSQLPTDIAMLQRLQQQAIAAARSSPGGAKVEVQPVAPGLSGPTGMDLLADVINSTLMGEALVQTEDSQDSV